MLGYVLAPAEYREQALDAFGENGTVIDGVPGGVRNVMVLDDGSVLLSWAGEAVEELEQIGLATNGAIVIADTDVPSWVHPKMLKREFTNADVIFVRATYRVFGVASKDVPLQASLVCGLERLDHEVWMLYGIEQFDAVQALVRHGAKAHFVQHQLDARELISA